MACPRGMDGGPDQGSQEFATGGSGTLGHSEATSLRRQPPDPVPGGSMGLTALCPKTFDPMTNGHLDVVGRTAQLFDSVIVGIVENPSKTPLFSVDERVQLLEETFRDLSNVRMESFRGLLVDHARTQKTSVIVKGLRAISD